MRGFPFPYMYAQQCITHRRFTGRSLPALLDGWLGGERRLLADGDIRRITSTPMMTRTWFALQMRENEGKQMIGLFALQVIGMFVLV